MTDRDLRAALISTDHTFRDQVRDLSRGPDLGLSLELEIAESFAAYSEEQVQALRQMRPDLIILDLEDDPELGVKFAQFLADANPAHKIVAVGPHLSSDLLLAAMRAGVADYLQKPVATGALHEALARISQTMGRATGKVKRSGQIYSIFGPKGGSGATGVATNLAIVLHRLTGKKTLLVDLDLELGEVALLLGVQPKFNFVDMVQNFHRMDAELLASYIEQHSSGVHLLSAPFHPERAELVTGEEIRRILHFLRQHYDYVVIDTPKSFSPATLAAFDQSDLVFLVTNVDLPSLRNIQRGLPMLKRVLPAGENQIRLVVNRYTASNDIALDDVERALGLKVFATIANDYEAVMQSMNAGKSIVLNGKSAYTRDLKALGGRVAGLKDVAGKNGRSSGTLMSRVFGAIGRRPEEASP